MFLSIKGEKRMGDKELLLDHLFFFNHQVRLSLDWKDFINVRRRSWNSSLMQKVPRRNLMSSGQS